jgi:hypothetical protein
MMIVVTLKYVTILMPRTTRVGGSLALLALISLKTEGPTGNEQKAQPFNASTPETGGRRMVAPAAPYLYDWRRSDCPSESPRINSTRWDPGETMKKATVQLSVTTALALLIAAPSLAQMGNSSMAKSPMTSPSTATPMPMRSMGSSPSHPMHSSSAMSPSGEAGESAATEATEQTTSMKHHGRHHHKHHRVHHAKAKTGM